MVYQEDKEYASKGVGTAGLTTGIIGTVGAEQGGHDVAAVEGAGALVGRVKDDYVLLDKHLSSESKLFVAWLLYCGSRRSFNIRISVFELLHTIGSPSNTLSNSSGLLILY